MSADNIECIRQQLILILCVEVDECSIRTVMKRVRDDPRRYEGLEETNNRVIDQIISNYESYVRQGTRNRNWANHYTESQLIINPYGKTGPDFNAVKIANRFGECRIGGTLNFHFT